jgi:uncharacterized protein YbaA (DUF1428 family)
MANYVDGFVLPVPRRHLDEYRRLVEAAAEIWLEHGALEYREHVGDDLSSPGLRSFTELSDASNDDVVIFGWVSFDSRESRDRANARVSNDPRMTKLIEADGSGFDARRMAYGGFLKLVSLQQREAPR